MRTVIGTAVLAAVLAVTGCGSGMTDVSGKVTYKGKPVVFGTVVLVGSDGEPKNAPIQPDGTFTVAGMKPGPVKVAVTSPPPPGATAPKGAPKTGRDAGNPDKPTDTNVPVNPEVAKNWFPLPDTFSDPTKSGVTADVVAGKPCDVDLK